MRRKSARFLYLFGDLVTTIASWTMFFLYRKLYIENLTWEAAIENTIGDDNFAFGVTIIPFTWILLFFFFGAYRDLYRKSRLKELFNTALIVFIGSIVIFFSILLDDLVIENTRLFRSFLALFNIHFITVFTWRFIAMTWAKKRIQSRKIAFNTLLIGGNHRAKDLYLEYQDKKKSIGNHFIGYIQVNGNKAKLDEYIPNLGKLEDVKRIIIQNKVEEVIIAIESTDHEQINEIVNDLVNINVMIKIIPDINDILTGSVKINNVFGSALMEVHPEIMPPWQKTIKRTMDIVLSIIAMIILAPLYAYIMIRVKLSSPGPIFYKQERIGIHGQTFKIIKFRSMYTDAEKSGPALSSGNKDSRITPWGHTMRKLRLDEFPQFWNVLVGDMSLVGPRPERQFFIDQILPLAPHYKYINKVRPGITSLGQVKYGYAENVEEMVKRLKYDILYIENMSLGLDLKIIMYTVLVVIQGRGK